jgi:hypothetical protein
MGPDMFREFGVNSILTIILLSIALGVFGSKGCSYVCNKYEVKILDKKQ